MTSGVDIELQTDGCILSDIAITEDGVLVIADTMRRLWFFDASGKLLHRVDVLRRNNWMSFGPFLDCYADTVVLSDYDEGIIAIFRRDRLQKILRPEPVPWRVAIRENRSIVYTPHAIQPALYDTGPEDDEAHCLTGANPFASASIPIIEPSGGYCIVASYEGNVRIFDEHGNHRRVIDFGPARYSQYLRNRKAIVTTKNGTFEEPGELAVMLWAWDACLVSDSLGICILHGCEGEHFPMFWILHPDRMTVSELRTKLPGAYKAVAKLDDRSVIVIPFETTPTEEHKLIRVSLA